MARKAKAEKPTPPDDYDSPWKFAIGGNFPAFMAHYFTGLHNQIDWSVPPIFLDTELNKLTRDAKIGKRQADKLAQVSLLSGEERMVYIHVEVQGQHDPDLAQRVYIYNYRIFDKFKKPVASLVVLADDRPSWRPDSFSCKVLGCEVRIQFPMVKVDDFRSRKPELMLDTNVFALVTLAHLLTQETKDDMGLRLAEKWMLTKLLLRRGLERRQVVELFRVIDWMMHLPDELAKELWQNIEEFEEEQKMEYISSVERLIIEREKQKSLEEGVQQERNAQAKKTASRLLAVLANNFGEAPKWAADLLASAPLEQIEAWFDRALFARKMEDVFGDLTRTA